MMADLGEHPGLLGESEDPRTVMEQSLGVMDGVMVGDAVLPPGSRTYLDLGC